MKLAMNTVRTLLLACGVFCLFGNVNAEPARVTPGYRIELSRDGGSHPDFRTEWWYVTGWVQGSDGIQTGFQITFFRSRNESADANPSKFSPRQLLIAHAALSHPSHGKLLRAERIARTGFGLVAAHEGVTNVTMDDWYLRTEGEDYVTRITADDFSLSLRLISTQAPLLQGDNGYSRKGPDPKSASYYYSLPQLQVKGSLAILGRETTVTGHAWLDHEWSSEYLDANATGWDWLGLNLLDGSALMVFRIRDAADRQYWAGGAWRNSKNDPRNSPRNNIYFSPTDIHWTPLRQWRSPRTGIQYPVSWRVKAGALEITLRPIMDDQENDTRGSTGVLYWEGAVEAIDNEGKIIGRGYLELTGYGERLEL